MTPRFTATARLPDATNSCDAEKDEATREERERAAVCFLKSVAWHAART